MPMPSGSPIGGITRMMPQSPQAQPLWAKSMAEKRGIDSMFKGSLGAGREQAAASLDQFEADLDLRDRQAAAMQRASAPTPVEQMGANLQPGELMPMMPSGGRGGYGRGNGGQLPSFQGQMRPRAPRKSIKGFSRKAAGLPDFGGLDEYHLLQKTKNPAFYQGSQGTGAYSVGEVAQNLRERSAAPQLPQMLATPQPGQNPSSFVKQAIAAGAKPYREGGTPRPGEMIVANEEGPELVQTQDGALRPLGDGRPAMFRAPAAPVNILPLTDIARFEGMPYGRQARTALRRSLMGSEGAEKLGQLALQDALQERRDAQEMVGRKELTLFNQGLQAQERDEQRAYSQKMANEQRGYNEKLTDEQIGATLAGAAPALKELVDKGFISQDQWNDYSSQTKPSIRASMADTLIKMGQNNMNLKREDERQQRLAAVANAQEVVDVLAAPYKDSQGKVIGTAPVAKTRGGTMKPLGAPSATKAEPSAKDPTLHSRQNPATKEEEFFERDPTTGVLHKVTVNDKPLPRSSGPNTATSAASTASSEAMRRLEAARKKKPL